MSEYMLEIVVNGVAKRMMLEAVPVSLTLKLYKVDRSEVTTKIAEKVVL